MVSAPTLLTRKLSPPPACGEKGTCPSLVSGSAWLTRGKEKGHSGWLSCLHALCPHLVLTEAFGKELRGLAFLLLQPLPGRQEGPRALPCSPCRPQQRQLPEALQEPMHGLYNDLMECKRTREPFCLSHSRRPRLTFFCLQAQQLGESPSSPSCSRFCLWMVLIIRHYSERGRGTRTNKQAACSRLAATLTHPKLLPRLCFTPLLGAGRLFDQQTDLCRGTSAWSPRRTAEANTDTSLATAPTDGNAGPY